MARVIWREVPGFSNYEMDSTGLVRNKKLNHNLKSTGTVALSQDGRRRAVSVRVLMLEVFPELRTRT